MGFQTPPKEIYDMVLADPAPLRIFNGDLTLMAELARNNYLSLEELAQEELRLAGVRFNPDTYSASRQAGFSSVRFVAIPSPGQKKRKPITVSGLPEGAAIRFYSWAPDYQHLALFVKESTGVYAYIVSPQQGQARRASDRRMHAIEHTRIYWTSNRSFLMETVPDGDPRHQRPLKRRTPRGPIVQGEQPEPVGATRTYQDLLRTEYDEQLFQYYFTSQLVHITLDGTETPIGQPAIYESLALSPNRQHLLVITLQAPYSHRVGKHHFPKRIEVWRPDGTPECSLGQRPEEIAPIGLDTCISGPRSYSWRADAPASLTWIEACDGGNPKQHPDAPCADVVYQLDAPFTQPARPVVSTQYRCVGLFWGDSQQALVSQRSRQERQSLLQTFIPFQPNSKHTLFAWSTQDKYSDPGQLQLIGGPYGEEVVLADAQHRHLYFRTEGASQEGNRPALYRYDLVTGTKHIEWQSQAPYYEQVVACARTAGQQLRFITSRQSATQPANLYLHNFNQPGIGQRLTHVTNPYKGLQGVQKKLVHYTRRDGVALTATVYLPKGYQPQRDGRLPVLMWAYPKEFKSAAEASQTQASPYTFTPLRYSSPVFWVTQGYCIMDHVDMPIVGSSTSEPNDHYIEQLTMDAEAAVNYIVGQGIGDRDRIAIGGHSYGAFMTANLMTHTRLFRAGIARSGAYNRTLTPFGFQSEIRSYWQVPEVYNAMSPFMHADQLSGALLLVHGEMDNNPGTFPMQSERFYQALHGNHADCRYVVLPYEGHCYQARENILHLLFEQHMWLESHLAPPQPVTVPVRRAYTPQHSSSSCSL